MSSLAISFHLVTNPIIWLPGFDVHCQLWWQLNGYHSVPRSLWSVWWCMVHQWQWDVWWSPYICLWQDPNSVAICQLLPKHQAV